jgi:hypothetical protein
MIDLHRVWDTKRQQWLYPVELRLEADELFRRAELFFGDEWRERLISLMQTPEHPKEKE